MKDVYPFNFLQSKLYHWHLNQTLNTAYTMLMLPKIVLDCYINTFKQVYRPV